MSVTLKNITTSDDYTTANTIELGTAVACKYTVANAAVLVEWRKHDDAHNDLQPFGDEELVLPEQNIKRGVSGFRVRSAIAGVGAQVTAVLLDPDEADTESGTPFSSYVSPAGTVAASLAMQTGDIFFSASSAARTGAVACDGTHYNSVADPSYANLYAKIGTLFGGTGPSDFAVPDLRGRVALGADPTGAHMPTLHPAVAGAGGEETHALTVAELAAHTHPASGGAFYDRHDAGGLNAEPVGSGTDRISATANTGSSGNGNAHNNVQPFLAFAAFIVK